MKINTSAAIAISSVTIVITGASQPGRRAQQAPGSSGTASRTRSAPATRRWPRRGRPASPRSFTGRRRSCRLRLVLLELRPPDRPGRLAQVAHPADAGVQRDQQTDDPDAQRIVDDAVDQAGDRLRQFARRPRRPGPRVRSAAPGCCPARCPPTANADHQDRHQRQEGEVRHRAGELAAQPIAVPGDGRDQVFDARACMRSACPAASPCRVEGAPGSGSLHRSPGARRRQRFWSTGSWPRHSPRLSPVAGHVTVRSGDPDVPRDSVDPRSCSIGVRSPRRPIDRCPLHSRSRAGTRSTAGQPPSRPTFSYTAADVASATSRARFAPAASTLSSSP